MKWVYKKHANFLSTHIWYLILFYLFIFLSLSLLVLINKITRMYVNVKNIFTTHDDDDDEAPKKNTKIT